MLDYINPYHIYAYYNTKQFMQDEFGESSIQKYSKLKSMDSDDKNPDYFTAKILQNELNDETAVIQWG